MKKYLFLTLILGSCILTTTFAQSGGPSATTQVEANPAVMLQQTKDKISPLMVEKTGLTKDKADKVVEILFEMRQGAAALQGLDEAGRSAKLTELKAVKDQKMNALLTPDEIQAVRSFYEDMGKKMQKGGK